MLKLSLLKKITFVLLGIVIILLVVNIVVTKFVSKNEPPKNREAISGIELDHIFKTALSNFGFSGNWIVKKKLKDIVGDSLYSTYLVNVPKDVPIQLLNLEIKNLLWDYDIEINAEELIKTKKTLLKLTSGKHLKLAAEFIYSDDIKRQYGTTSFLVKDLPLSDEEILNSILATPELYYCVLIPCEESKKSLSLLAKASKRYALLLNDNITELNFTLSDKLSENRIKKSIKEIVGAFYSAAFFIIDVQSDLFESNNFKIIESELKKRGILLVHSSSLSVLASSNVNAEDNFQNFMQTLQSKDEKVLLVSADEFSSIINLIPAYRKIGFKFIYPGDIIIKNPSDLKQN